MTDNRRSVIEKETLINESQPINAQSWFDKFIHVVTSIYGLLLFAFINFRYRNYILAAKSLMVHLEHNIFPILKEKRIRWLDLEIAEGLNDKKMFIGKAGNMEYKFPGTVVLVNLMQAIGIKHFRLNTSLEFNQLLESLVIFVYVSGYLNSGSGPIDKPDYSWNKKTMANHMLSEKGLHRFCADLKYFPDSKTFEIDYTYCELLMSRALRGFTSKNKRLGDHRVFFDSGYKIAGISFGFFSFLLILNSIGINLIYPAWVLFTVLVPLLLWGLMITFGSIQYAKEHDEFLKNEFLHHENLLAKFPETNPNPIIKIDNKGTIKYANPATYKFMETISSGGSIEEILPDDYIDIAKNCKETMEVEIKVSEKYLKYMISFFSDDDSLIFTGTDITGLRQTELALRHINNNLEQLVDDRTKELHLTQTATITCLAGLSEIRDPETGEHIERTRIYVKVLAEHLKDHPKFKDYLSAQVIENLYKSAPLHDIGKVGIPDNILLKPGKLTDDEFTIMKKHANFGATALQQAVKSLGFDSVLNVGMEIARSHHEKWNGKGYPDGLSKYEIPIAARLMALADVYDALISRRVYKEPFSHEKAVGIITGDRGEHFDPDVVDAFIAIEETFKEIAKKYPDSQ